MEEMEDLIEQMLEKYTENVSVNFWVPAIHKDKHQNLTTELLLLFKKQQKNIK